LARTPVVGISSYPRDGKPLSFGLPCAYVDVVRAAGATPLILPPGEPRPERLLDILNALILSGGGDIDAGSYGGDRHETAYNVSEERDAFEFALARAALAREDIPVLCICRGMQILNVVCGGTLHGHIPEKYGERINHRLPPRLPVRHSVRIEAGRRLAAILGETEVEVCSWHHQAIDRIGENLEAVGFAGDGVIEAVEHSVHPWCIGIQWHPEMQGDEEPQKRLFAALLAAIDDIREGKDGRKT